MRAFQKAIILGITLVLLSISTIYAADEIKVADSYDNYTKTTGIATSKFNVPGVDSFFAPAFAFASLRGTVSDADMESMELWVYYSGTEWKFFSSALDENGNSFMVKELDREIESAHGINEQVAAVLTRPYLEAHRESGLNIRFGGKYGLLVVKLPSAYVQAFLSRLEQVKVSVTARLANASNSSIVTSPGKVKLGVNYLPVDAAFAKVAGMAMPKGVYIVKVADGSTAHHAGILVGDVVLTLNNIEVQSTITGLPDAIATIQSGSLASMTIWRNAKETTLPVQF